MTGQQEMMWGLGDPGEKLPFLELLSSLKAFRTREHRPYGGWMPLGLPCQEILLQV